MTKPKIETFDIECKHCNTKEAAILIVNNGFKLVCPNCGSMTDWCISEEEALELWNKNKIIFPS